MIPHDLVAALKDRRVVLFVGAGISMNLGLPSFHDLVSQIGKDLGFDSDIFHTFADHPTLAEYYKLERGGIGNLRSWMDTTWHPKTIDIAASEVHNRIVDLNCPIIYTTNWDRWIEEAYRVKGRAFLKITGVRDLAKPKNGDTEIIKFHGDFSDDESLVLTESDYFARMNFESPLDLRLRADSLGRPLLFIGYRLSDLNMRYLLYKLEGIWAGSKDRPKSYILFTRPNVVQERVLEARGIVPIIWKRDDSGTAVVDFLTELVAATR